MDLRRIIWSPRRTEIVDLSLWKQPSQLGELTVVLLAQGVLHCSNRKSWTHIELDRTNLSFKGVDQMRLIEMAVVNPKSEACQDGKDLFLK